MIVNKNIKEYLVSVSGSLQEALKRINENKHKIVYAVSQKNYLVGSLTDGDIRRWILSTPDLDLNIDLSQVIKQPCFSLNVNMDPKKIDLSFNERITSIPLVDDFGHLVAIAEQKSDYFHIGKHRISNEDPVFIIAEVGNNHQGDINIAKQLVGLAVDAKVDCVKFQMRNMEKLYKNKGVSSDASADLGAQYTLDLLSKFQLSDEELFEVFDYCKFHGVTPLCTPWDLSSLEKLEKYGMPAYKVSSADFTNFELLNALSKTGKPLICSTGMSTESEIQATVSLLKKKNAQFVLLHCNSTYPTPYRDVNLSYLSHLKTSTDSLVGYSGHERGWSVPVAAVALGAKVIEKHFTVDKSLEGNDHKVSLLYGELKQMVAHIREVEESLGVSKPREITQGELMNREVLAKSLIANSNIEIGSVITEEMIDIMSPGQGLQPNRIYDLVGKKLTRPIQKGDYFFDSDINGGYEKKAKYKFDRPYGIPVRFHDFEALTDGIQLDFVEFHLSYKDLEVDLDDYINKNQNIGFAVHAPELFEGDHILDLASYDESYRQRSIGELANVIEKTKKLRDYFPITKKPVIVINAGGWNADKFLSLEEKKKKYALVKKSLEQLDLSDVEIAIQTMPPFPWHFGGQSHHNLFVDPNEIYQFCSESNIKICLDVSHTMMACNFYSWDLYDFVKLISPYNVHMHIVDAKGIDGEGIQIGEGDVDFDKLAEILQKTSPNVQFIPEVWQGHKNSGEGFWQALNYLEYKLN